MLSILQSDIIPRTPDGMSVATEIVLILLSTGGVSLLGLVFAILRKIYKEREQVYARVTAHREELDDRIDTLKKDVEESLDKGSNRMARIENKLTKLEASMDKQNADSRNHAATLDKLEKKFDRIDERMDVLLERVAVVATQVSHAVDLSNKASAEVTKFLTDSAPGRGITARLKKAVRDIVKPEALTRPEETLYPEGAIEDVYIAETPKKKPSSPRLPAHHDTRDTEVLQPPPDENDRPQHKTNPPRPLMRTRRPPSEPTSS